MKNALRSCTVGAGLLLGLSAQAQQPDHQPRHRYEVAGDAIGFDQGFHAYVIQWEVLLPHLTPDEVDIMLKRDGVDPALPEAWDLVHWNDFVESRRQLPEQASSEARYLEFFRILGELYGRVARSLLESGATENLETFNREIELAARRRHITIMDDPHAEESLKSLAQAFRVGASQYLQDLR